MDVPEIGQLPGAPKQNAPTSGTYGLAAAADRLKSGMTTEAPPQAPPVSTMPGGAKPEASQGPFGLPAAITAPTQQPNVPVSTPLAQPVNPVANAVDASQKRLALLDMLSRNPDVSDATREWAQTVLAKLIQNSKR